MYIIYFVLCKLNTNHAVEIFSLLIIICIFIVCCYFLMLEIWTFARWIHKSKHLYFKYLSWSKGVLIPCLEGLWTLAWTVHSAHDLHCHPLENVSTATAHSVILLNCRKDLNLQYFVGSAIFYELHI